MRKRAMIVFAFLSALFAAALIASPTPSHAACSTANYMMLGYGQSACPAAGGYTGPGDILAFSGWWGLRAYSTADRGNRLINVCNAGDANCVDMSSDATTGNLNVTLVGATDCSVSTCTIKTWYDRTGGGNNQSIYSIFTRAQLIVSCINSLPCARFVGASSNSYQAVSSTLSQPYEMVFVGARTANFTTAQSIMAYGSNVLFGYAGSSNNALLYAGSSLTTAGGATDNTWHRIQGVANGASSVLQVDATSNTVSPGTNGTSSPVTIGTDGFGDIATADVGEFGYANGATAVGTRNSLDTNMKTYYGL